MSASTASAAAHCGPGQTALAGAEANQKDGEEGGQRRLKEHQDAAAQPIVQAIANQIVQPRMRNPRRRILSEGIAVQPIAAIGQGAAHGQVQPHVTIARRRGGGQEGEGDDKNGQQEVGPRQSSRLRRRSPRRQRRPLGEKGHGGWRAGIVTGRWRFWLGRGRRVRGGHGLRFWKSVR